MKTNRFWLGAGAAVVIVLGGATWWGWHAYAECGFVAQSLPAIPDLKPATAAAQEAIRLADQRARSLWSARKGLEQLSRVYHANGFLEAASRCYEALDQLEPNEPRWLHRHAIILAGYGEIEPAMALWRRVVALAPDYLPARLRLADSLLKSNEVDQAAAIYADVLQRQPNNPYAQLGLARIDFEAKRWDQARPRLEALVVQTNYELGYDLIVSLYERVGEHDKAAAVRGMIKASGAYRDPNDPWMEELLDDCYDPYRLSVAAGTMLREAAPQAVKLLQRAIRLAPNEASNHFQLGMLAKQIGDEAMARAELEACTRISPEFTDGWAQYSGLLFELGDKDGSDRVLEEALRRNPNSPGLHLTKARRLQRVGATEQAISEYKLSAELRSNESDAFLELGNLLISLGRTQEGIEQVQRGYKVEPANPMAISILTFNAILQGDEKEARRWFERVRLQPRVGADQVSALTAAYEKQFGHAP